MADATRDSGASEGRIEPLLADANRLRARGDFEAAEQRCRQALTIAPGGWQTYELLGDIMYQQRRGEEAIEHYRLAKAANPKRAALEDKIGRASLLIAEKEFMRLRAQELLGGERDQVPRRPSIAALLSLVVPGFGQLYNREHVKGAMVVTAWLMLVLGAAGAALGSLHPLHGGMSAARPGSGQLDLAAIVNVFFSRPTLWWTMLSIALWLYAVADAALRAARTMAGPEDLV